MVRSGLSIKTILGLMSNITTKHCLCNSAVALNWYDSKVNQ